MPTKTPSPQLNIVVALPCEAKPLITGFKLKKRLEKSPFPVFSHQDNSIHLVVAGVGKVRAATATTFLALYFGQHAHATYLNVGIAGSQHYALGDAVWANKIIEVSTERVWYPHVSLFNYPVQTVLETHDLPQAHYPLQGMVDMEGSAFFQAATQWVSQEQVQIFKIISDHSIATQQAITANNVQDLISARLPEICNLTNYLIELSQQESSLLLKSTWLTEFCVTWHFTHTEKQQLNEYLRRWQINYAEHNAMAYCKEARNAKQVLEKLRERV